VFDEKIPEEEIEKSKEGDLPLRKVLGGGKVP